MSNNNEASLPQSYHWNRAQSRLSLIGAGAFFAMAGAAYVIGGANVADVNEICAPENTACIEYVEGKNFQDKIILSGLFLVVAGVGLSISSQQLKRAEEIKEKHTAPGNNL
jgi:hypothetical protein